MRNRRLAEIPRELRRRIARGTTLAELMVAMAIGMVVLLAVYRLYAAGRRNYEQPRASLNLQEDMMRAVQLLQRDLMETNIQSVRSYPNASAPNERPGLSLISPRSTADDQVVLGEFGVVRWQKYVYYTVLPDPKRAGVGFLSRREGLLTDQPNVPEGDSGRRIPLPSPVLPSAAPGVNGPRNLCGSVMLPNTSVPGLITLESHGGFYCYWMNGTTKAPFDTASAGEPIYVDIRLSDVSQTTGKTSVLSFPVQTTPRN